MEDLKTYQNQAFIGVIGAQAPPIDKETPLDVRLNKEVDYDYP
jgi:hypothetical protein